MATSSATVLSDRKAYLSPWWRDKLSRLIVGGRKNAALDFLESAVQWTPPLFNGDPMVFEARRTAWLIRTQLLLEWNRPAEALAWACLECQLSPESPEAEALRDRLLHQLNLDAGTSESQTDKGAAGTQWPGVAGMHELKANLERDVISCLRHPEEAIRYGISLPSGILLYGPPGCGKTFIARKIAEKLAFNFVEIKPGDLASIYVHGTQERLKEVFEEAAKNAPTVLFFDELDAFAPKREIADHHYSAEVNEFLVRLNNCSEQNVLVIGATNYIERVDEAVTRAGRMDLHYFVGLPDFAARAELFRHYLKDRPCARLDWRALAECSMGYTPADIALLATQAAKLASAQGSRISMSHIQTAMQNHPPRVQPERPMIGFRS